MPKLNNHFIEAFISTGLSSRHIRLLLMQVELMINLSFMFKCGVRSILTFPSPTLQICIRGNATALCDTTGSLTYDLSCAVTSESQCSAWYLVFGRWSILDIDIDCCLLNADAYDLASSINILFWGTINALEAALADLKNISRARDEQMSIGPCSNVNCSAIKV